MKIAVIGNSHVIALKESFIAGRINFQRECTVDFYAATARDAHRVVVKDKMVIPLSDRTKKFYELTSRGKGAVDLGSYDVVWIYGLTEQLDKIGTWFQSVKSNNAFSQEVKNKSFVDRYNVGIELAKDVSNVCPNVFVSPRPMPSKFEFIESSCDISNGSMNYVIDFMNSHAKKSNAVFLSQPSESLVDNEIYMTDEKYSEGSNGLSLKLGSRQAIGEGNSARQDYLHMNEAFGDLMWEKFYKEMGRLGGRL